MTHEYAPGGPVLPERLDRMPEPPPPSAGQRAARLSAVVTELRWLDRYLSRSDIGHSVTYLAWRENMARNVLGVDPTDLAGRDGP